MTDGRVRALVFGEVADEYDRVRPGYPAALVDDVLEYARLDGAPVLDVGAGTGRAALAFADRGVDVTAVEPDPAMAAVLRRRAAGRRVVVVVTRFEEYRPEQPFGLLTSGQAWHWIDPALCWERAAAALGPGGALAMFWNQDRPADPAVAAELRAAHERHAPDLWRAEEPPDEADMDWPELAAQPAFGDMTTRLYRWQRTLSTADYVTNLVTQSSYRLLDEAVRDALFADIVDRVAGPIAVDLDTALYLARRR